MAGPRQQPAPYDGMGTPTRWDASTHDDGNQAERLDAARADRFAPGDAAARRERRVRAPIAQPLLPMITTRTDQRSSAAASTAASPDGLTEPPRMLTGAQIALESLIREGVDTIFGYPGGANLWLYRHLPELPGAPPRPGSSRAGRRPCSRRIRAQQARIGWGGLCDQRSRARSTSSPGSPPRTWTRSRWLRSPARCPRPQSGPIASRSPTSSARRCRW